MNSSYIVTFIGDDKPGLVEALARVIAQHEGNWLQSRLSQLSGKFAGLIEINLPTASSEALESALRAMDDNGLSVRVTACNNNGSTALDGQTLTLSVIGPDRPGIVREISAELSRQSFNILTMDSQVSIAPMSSEHLFEAMIDAQAPAGVSPMELSDKLDIIADDMTLDIDIAEQVRD